MRTLRRPAGRGGAWRSVWRLLAPAVMGVALLSACSTAHGGARPRPFRIAYLGARTPESGAPLLADLRSVLSAGGWVEGRDYVLDVRWASGNLELLPALAADLVKNKPDVIWGGTDAGAAAAHQATTTIPIVGGFCGNPIAEGLVQSLAHPGGNVTGTSTACLSGDIHAKDLELLKATVPGLHRVAVLWDAQLPDAQTVLAGIQQSAQTLDLVVQLEEVQTAADLPGAVSAAAAAQVEGLFAPEDSFMTGNEAAIISAVVQARLPAVFEFRDFADLGALLSYGANLRELTLLGFGYMKRILQGEKPAELPVVQPATFELVVNLKAAQALGITVPDSVLAQATDVLR